MSQILAPFVALGDRRLAGRAVKPAIFAVIFAALFLFMIGPSPSTFVVDEALYLAMTDALTTRGDLAFALPLDVADAPPLTITLTTIGVDGRVYPQYPIGYAVIAAPFYMIWGVYGLFLLNALSGLAAIGLTHEIARRLFGDDKIAALSALLFAGASFFPTYAFSIWPHMLTLALLLGAALLAIVAVTCEKPRALVLLALSGALIGVATTVRVDSIIFLAPIFIWLRLFAAPQFRGGAFAFLAGGAPILSLSTLVNIEKFGIASPITYGDKTGYEEASAYAPLAIALALGVLIIGFFDVARRSAPLIARARRLSPLVMIALVLIAVLTPPGARLAHHFWTLLFDIQTYNGDYYHDLLTIDAGGFKTSYGLPKKALLESMPFLALVIIPALGVFRRPISREAAFCFLFAAAPIVFFGVRQWHGGHAVNMRFFFPALPFLTMLAATSFLQLWGDRRFKARDALLIAAGLTIVLLFQMAASLFAPTLGVPAFTLPQLAIALALLAGATAFAAGRLKGARGALVSLSLFAIGAAGASNVGDFELTRQVRYYAARNSAEFERVLPKGSLVVALEDMQFVPAMLRGVFLYHPQTDDPQTLVAAIDAFERAKACVYIRRGEVAAFVEAVSDIRLVPAYAPGAADGALTTPAPMRPECTLP